MIQYLEGSLVLPEEAEREGFYVSIPRRLMPDVLRLLEYKMGFDLGPVEGLDLLLGENIAGNARAGSSYLKRCRRGGAIGGKRQREESKFKHTKVVQKATLLLEAKVSRRGLASHIKMSGSGNGLSTRQINNILKSEM